MCKYVALGISLSLVYILSFALAGGVQYWAAYREQQEQDRTRARSTSLLAYALLRALQILSNPFGVAQFAFVGRAQTDAERAAKRSRIDRWILFWATFDVVLLILVVPSFPEVAIVPLLRLFDVLHVIIRMFVTAQKPQVPARSALFLILHYFETVTTFACLYLLAQHWAGRNLFSNSAGTAILLDRGTAFYFSVITAATVGYGDIIPAALVTRALVFLEILCAFYIVAVDIPYVLGAGQSSNSPQG